MKGRKGQRVNTEMGAGRVASVSPLNGYLYVDIDDKGINKFDLKEVKFDRREAKKLQNTLSAEEKQLKNLENE